MGGIASTLSSGMKTTMDENFKRQQAFQMEAFQLQMERQLVMQNEIRERQVSMQVGRARQIVKYYYGPFYSLVVAGGLMGMLKTHNPAFIIPAIPFGFIFAFQADMAYGNLMQRSREEAETIMTEERERLKLPNDMPTFQSVESKRLAQKSG